MTGVYANQTRNDKLKPAQEKFETIINQLLSGEVAKLTHGSAEELINKEGTELLRILLQGYLDVRAFDETRRESVTGSDGIVRNRCRKDCKRDLESIFGEVVVTRCAYNALDTNSLFPLDAELNLPIEKYSHGLRIRASYEVQKSSFGESLTSIVRTTGGMIPNRQIQQISDIIAQDFDDFYKVREFDSQENTKDLLVMTTDGKGIVMRHESLRDHTRHAAERDHKKLKTRLSKGEKRNRKRMSTVASVYTIETYERTPEQIMSSSNNSDNADKPPKPQNKRVWASVERSAKEVIDEVFQEALRRDPLKLRQWVMLVDGEPRQLAHIQDCIKKYKVDVFIVLDFIHVLEYLWKASYCFNNEGSEEAEKWVGDRALKILKGQMSGVAAGITRSATLRKLDSKKRLPADKCADYLLKYKSFLQYDLYLKEGLPIATGVIEGACRYLVKDRMDITGARWGLKSAEAILKLRSLYASDDYDEYFEFHKEQEFKRNHQSKYEDSLVKLAA